MIFFIIEIKQLQNKFMIRTASITILGYSLIQEFKKIVVHV